jgi:hypothetical protein
MIKAAHRTSPNLTGAANIEANHLSEAVQLRSLDRQIWA